MLLGHFFVKEEKTINLLYNRKPDESDMEYGLRLIIIKIEQKPDDLDWSDIVELLRLDIHKDSLRKAAAVTPYSGYAVMKYFKEKMYECLDTEQMQQLKEKELEIKKQTILMRDERNELNNKIREFARAEKIINIFKEIISEEVHPYECFTPTTLPSINSEKDMVIMLSDIHYGLMSNNSFNYYDTEVAKERLQKYLEKIFDIVELHEPKDCHLVLGGDLISGVIHSTIRSENMENVVTQIKEVSELISEFTFFLSGRFENVIVHHVPGNHSRVTQRKDDNDHGDYLDSLIPHYMKAALKHIGNICIDIEKDNYLDDEISCFWVRNNYFVAVHGQNDSVKNVLNNMTRMCGFIPDAVLLGHRHTNGLTTIDKTKVVECGSLSGTDSYCIENRLIGNPEQICFLVTEDSVIDCLYDIQLDE